MFEKFTERARRAVFFARYEAQKRRAWAIEPEHLLSGLLREDPDLFRLLSGDTEDQTDGIRIALEAHLSQSDTVQSPNDIPLSPFGKQVIKLAAENSPDMAHSHVGTEHLLLAIIKQGQVKKRGWFSYIPQAESAASRILREKGLTSDKVVERIRGGSITPQTREPLAGITAVMLRLNCLIEVLMRKGIFTEKEFLDSLGGKAPLPDISATLKSLVNLLVRQGAIDLSDEYEVLGLQHKPQPEPEP